MPIAQKRPIGTETTMLVAVERHGLLRAQRRQVKRQRVDRPGKR
jgi:hypothetical protein